jgi:hypothetical protein
MSSTRHRRPLFLPSSASYQAAYHYRSVGHWRIATREEEVRNQLNLIVERQGLTRVGDHLSNMQMLEPLLLLPRHRRVISSQMQWLPTSTIRASSVPAPMPYYYLKMKSLGDRGSAKSPSHQNDQIASSRTNTPYRSP